MSDHVVRYFHKLIQDFNGNEREYISGSQDGAPSGWIVVAVIGYHDVPTDDKRFRKGN